MASRTLQKTVRRIVASLGDQAPSSAVSTSQTIQVAVDAVNDAVADIYSRAKWPFRLKFCSIVMSGGCASYALPDDFGEFQLETISAPGSPGAPIKFSEYADLMAAHPQWPIRSADNALNGYMPLDVIGDYAGAMFEASGVPAQFTEWNKTLMLWPPPSAEFAAAYQILWIPYYAHAPELIADADILPLPQNLWAACTYMAQSLLKQYLEYPDSQIDAARAERMINTQLRRKSLVARRTLRFRVR